MATKSPTKELFVIDATPSKRDDLLIIRCAAASLHEMEQARKRLEWLLGNFKHRICSVASDEGGFDVGATAICTGVPAAKVHAITECIELLGLRNPDQAYVRRSQDSRRMPPVGSGNGDEEFLTLDED